MGLSFEKTDAKTNLKTDSKLGRRRAEIVASLEKHRKKIMRIDLCRRVGRTGYKAIGMFHLHPDEGETDSGKLPPLEPPTEIWAKIYEHARDDSIESGSEWYAVVFYDDGDKTVGGRLPFPISDDTIDSDDEIKSNSGEANGELLRIIRSLTNTNIALQKQNLSDLQLLQGKVIELVDVVTKQPYGEQLVKLFKIQRDREAVRIEADLREKRTRNRHEVLKDMATPIGQVLSMIGLKLAKEHGLEDLFGNSGAMAAQLQQILEKIPEDKVDEVQEAMGDDLWDLIIAGAKAGSDEEFAAIFQRAHEIVTDMGTQRVNVMAGKLMTILDKATVIQLFTLIEKAANQTAA